MRNPFDDLCDVIYAFRGSRASLKVRALLRYHDFSRWFIPLKGEEVRNGWAIGIPIIQPPGCIAI